MFQAPAAECDIGQVNISSVILNNSRTVSMLLIAIDPKINCILIDV